MLTWKRPCSMRTVSAPRTHARACSPGISNWIVSQKYHTPRVLVAVLDLEWRIPTRAETVGGGRPRSVATPPSSLPTSPDVIRDHRTSGISLVQTPHPLCRAQESISYFHHLFHLISFRNDAARRGRPHDYHHPLPSCARQLLHLVGDAIVQLHTSLVLYPVLLVVAARTLSLVSYKYIIFNDLSH